MPVPSRASWAAGRCARRTCRAWPDLLARRSCRGAVPADRCYRTEYSVREAAHLSDRLVRRISDVEFIVHGDTHWVEAPSRVLERGLRRVLFEERGMVADPLGDSVALSCELVSLEEDRRNAPVARVVLHLELSRNHRLIRAKTLIREVSITSPKIEATAHALGEALEQAIAGVADWVSL